MQLWKGSIHVAGFYLYSSIPIDIVIYRVQLTKPELLYKVVAAFRVGVCAAFRETSVFNSLYLSVYLTNYFSIGV